MNYPVWNLPVLGGSLTVAIIAIIHVLISHLAIGGGAFIAVAEMWAARSKDKDRIRKWLHKFATFFLVYTTVLGAVTGVGIWFSIQLASPEATSLLIHQYVFAWATEWVTFIGELTVLYLYYYGWNTNSERMQVFLAVAYFVVAWFSLFIINGILTFMLTPGGWTLENRDIFQGFFNPGYLPALLIRTLIMFLVAGLAGILIATKIEDDDDFKTRIIRFCAKWVIPAAVLVPVFGLWYFSSLPESTVKIFKAGVTGLNDGKMEGLNRFFWLAVTAFTLVVIGTAAAAWKPTSMHFASALALMLIAQSGFLGGEFFREMARKPYVIKGVLYSNSLWRKNTTDRDWMSAPFFSHTKWDPDPAPMSKEHGEWMYRLECASCHTLTGYRSLMDRTVQWTPAFGVRFLEKLDAQGIMPPFQGSVEDRAALTSWFMSLHGQTVSADEVLSKYQKEEAENKADAASAKEVKK
jgi:cytochrome bd-type quinol oxidase subunit 1